MNQNNFYYGHGNLIRLESNGMEASDVAELLDALSPHFFEVRLSVRPSPPAASPLGFDFATVLVAVAIASQGFFSELVKDAYRGLRELILSTGRKARHSSQARGGYSLAARIDRDKSYVLFAFVAMPGGPDELGTALTQVPELVATTDEDQFVCFEYDAGAKRWKEPWTLDKEATARYRESYLANEVERESRP